MLLDISKNIYIITLIVASSSKFNILNVLFHSATSSHFCCIFAVLLLDFACECVCVCVTSMSYLVMSVRAYVEWPQFQAPET